MLLKKLLQYLPLFLLVFNTALNAQQHKFSHAKFTAVPIDKSSKRDLSKIFKTYSLCSLDTDAISAFTKQNQGNEMVLDLDFPGLNSFSLTLKESDILSPDYQTIIASENGEVISQKRHISYEGSITNKDYNHVRLTITNNVIYGIIKTDDKEYFIEPMSYLTGLADRDMFVIYETGDVVSDSFFKCGVTETTKETSKILDNNKMLALGDCFRVELVIASDESAVTAIGGSALDMEVYNIGLMNTVAPYFKDFQFPTNVELVLVGQYISTSVATDPYDVDCTSCAINDQLISFGNWANNGGFGSIDYDLAHNITNHFSRPGTVGLAYVGVLGSSQTFNTAVTSIADNTAATWLTFIHELGHNFGLNHSFEEGQGTTGGFMDSTDGKLLNGEYGWNLTYREQEFESEVNTAPISVCSSIGPAIADFESPSVFCIGSTNVFKNKSLGGATSYSWSFSDGTPSTSTDISPSVTFSTSGTKTISLTATNENGSNIITKTIVIDNPTPPTCNVPGTWTTNANDGGPTFFKLNTISKTSGGSLSDENYYLDYSCTDNTILELGTMYNVNVSHVYEGSQTSQNQLFIDYNNDGDFSDANEVAYDGTDLNFSITTPGSGVIENQLLRARLIVKLSTSDLDPCYQPDQGMGQIEDYGVYFLNENSLSINDNTKLAFSVYPNPARDGNFTIRMPNATKDTKFVLYNSLGQIVYSSFLKAEISNNIKLNTSVSNGLYFMKVTQGGKELIKKLVLQRG